MIIQSLDTGTILDCSPEQEITFTLDNPIFEDDRIAVAVSTGIEFPPTPTNAAAFGFVPAMMFAPQCRELPAAIFIGGIQIFVGKLQFDEFSDGNLKYTFIGTSPDDSFAGKIYDIEPDQTHEGVPSTTLVKNARKGLYEDFGLPQIVHQANSAKIEYATANGAADCSIADKYANYLYSEIPRRIVPAIKVGYLLKKIMPETEIPASMSPYIDKLAVIAPYNGQGETADNGAEQTANASTFRTTERLPDMSRVEFVSNILKMFCATLFADGDKYRIRANNDIIDDTTFTDWSEQVAEVYTIVAGEESGYSLEYANQNSEFTPPKVDDFGQEVLGDAVLACSSYEDMIRAFTAVEEYINVRITQTGNIYSGKRVNARLYYDVDRQGVVYTDHEDSLPSLDIVYQTAIESITISGESEDAKTYENNIGFHCAKCIPAVVATPMPIGSTAAQVSIRGMSPVIDIPEITSERPTTVYVGLLLGHNFLDQGNYFSLPEPYVDPGSEKTDNILSIAIGGENGLYEKFHRKFAEWYMRKKDSVKADFFLTAADVAALRLWNKIMVYNRLFLIKTIEITISDNTDIIYANAELIEA